MKITALIFAILFFAIPAIATDLVCDPQAGVTHYDVEVNGTVTATNQPAQADGSLLYNVDAFTPGPYSFRARAKAGGWPSDWSSPLDARKPAGVGGLRIR